MLRRNRDDEAIGPTKGWAKVFHKLAMFLLWPLRKPLWFLLIVAVLYLAPTFRGVKPAEVHTWYWSKIKSSTSSVSTMVSDKTKNMLPNIEMPAFSISSPADKNAPAAKVVDMPVKDVRRKTFERAKSAPVAVDIMVQNASRQSDAAAQKPLPATSSTDGKQMAARPEQPAKKKLNLVYVSEAKNISGLAQIVNANEIKINGETIFLYGIYVNPNTEKGRIAKNFLIHTINGRPVDCVIEAYTYQGIATGICSAGKTNLNKALVDGNYSKNVALD